VPVRDALRARIILALADNPNIGRVAADLHLTRDCVRKWAKRFERRRVAGLVDALRSGRPPRFPPEVATYATKLACELPDDARRSLSLWSCGEIARTLARNGTVDAISADTINRMLGSAKLRPWRGHHWLSPPSAASPRSSSSGRG